MFPKRELLDAIAECERDPQNYHDCAKLATFYTIFDHLYPDTTPQKTVDEITIDEHGNSDFLQAVAGCDATKVWGIMDELMGTLEAMYPPLYNSVLVKIAQTKEPR